MTFDAIVAGGLMPRGRALAVINGSRPISKVDPGKGATEKMRVGIKQWHGEVRLVMNGISGSLQNQTRVPV